MANLKKMSDELKSFFAQEISASTVNVTTSINNTMNRKLDQLNNRLNEINIRVNETKTLAENNTNRLEQLEEESKITDLRLEEYSRKIEQLEELVDDQINRNARNTLIIRGVKFGTARVGTTLKMFYQPLSAPSSVGTKTSSHKI